MRKMKENELEIVAKHMLDIFFDEIEITTTVKGINIDTAKKIMFLSLYNDMEYFYKYGEIFIYDNDFSGIITLINGKNFSLFKKIILSLKMNKKLFEVATKEEMKILGDNAKKLKEIHSYKWYKKRKNIPFYLAHIGIDENKRGKGICREMLEFVFDYIKNYNNEIALETFSTKNVSVYEHFGFEVVDKCEAKDKILTEYRMIKKL